ncbi:LacI family DNA-binding transcriptional regulator [Intestinimonas massiliensis (ex Afouda et al. 2020)]|uniref:LacI family DNA-binding transcriptional regulator n=1 Tax=Intestinimonas massiliensis (ex Afouda et al. 2020) TaxID=1673721 RepID=UPI001031C777|nr:LacI family DNA-binding transcriptional regulator [Intestinimonas massiliensis (ex Afouda et al. 2020)]
MAKVTIIDVANRAGVSISTVSRYLKDAGSINPVSSAKIDLAIRELNYVPNSFARNLKRGSADLIGVVEPDISQSFFSRTVKSVNNILYQNGYMLLVCDSDFQPRKEQFLINRLIEQNVSGILLATTGKNAEFLRKISERFPNIVLFDREEESLSLDCVVEDNEENGYRLTKHLIDQGGRRIAVLTGMSFASSTRQRLAGICRAAEEAGIPLSAKDTYMNGTNKEVIQENAARILEAGIYDTIIFTIPRSIFGIQSVLESRGMQLGKDVLVGGWSNRELFQQSGVRYPAIFQDADQMGTTVANRILRRVNLREEFLPSERIVLETELYIP